MDDTSDPGTHNHDDAQDQDHDHESNITGFDPDTPPESGSGSEVGPYQNRDVGTPGIEKSTADTPSAPPPYSAADSTEGGREDKGRGTGTSKSETLSVDYYRTEEGLTIPPARQLVNATTLYDVIGVDPAASEQHIQMILQVRREDFLPGENEVTGMDETDKRRYRQIELAGEILTTPLRRRVYTELAHDLRSQLAVPEEEVDEVLDRIGEVRMADVDGPRTLIEEYGAPGADPEAWVERSQDPTLTPDQVGLGAGGIVDEDRQPTSVARESNQSSAETSVSPETETTPLLDSDSEDDSAPAPDFDHNPGPGRTSESNSKSEFEFDVKFNIESGIESESESTSPSDPVDTAEIAVGDEDKGGNGDNVDEGGPENLTQLTEERIDKTPISAAVEDVLSKRSENIKSNHDDGQPVPDVSSSAESEEVVVRPAPAAWLPVRTGTDDGEETQPTLPLLKPEPQSESELPQRGVISTVKHTIFPVLELLRTDADTDSNAPRSGQESTTSEASASLSPWLSGVNSPSSSASSSERDENGSSETSSGSPVDSDINDTLAMDGEDGGGDDPESSDIDESGNKSIDAGEDESKDVPGTVGTVPSSAPTPSEVQSGKSMSELPSLGFVPDLSPDFDSDVGPKTEVETGTGTDPDSEIGSMGEAQTYVPLPAPTPPYALDTDAETGLNANTEPSEDTNADPDADTKAETEEGIEAILDAEVEAEAEAEVGAGTDPASPEAMFAELQEEYSQVGVEEVETELEEMSFGAYDEDDDMSIMDLVNEAEAVTAADADTGTDTESESEVNVEAETAPEVETEATVDTDAPASAPDDAEKTADPSRLASEGRFPEESTTASAEDLANGHLRPGHDHANSTTESETTRTPPTRDKVEVDLPESMTIKDRVATDPDSTSDPEVDTDTEVDSDSVLDERECEDETEDSGADCEAASTPDSATKPPRQSSPRDGPRIHSTARSRRASDTDDDTSADSTGDLAPSAGSDPDQSTSIKPTSENVRASSVDDASKEPVSGGSSSSEQPESDSDRSLFRMGTGTGSASQSGPQPTTSTSASSSSSAENKARTVDAVPTSPAGEIRKQRLTMDGLSKTSVSGSESEISDTEGRLSGSLTSIRSITFQNADLKTANGQTWFRRLVYGTVVVGLVAGLLSVLGGGLSTTDRPTISLTHLAVAGVLYGGIAAGTVYRLTTHISPGSFSTQTPSGSGVGLLLRASILAGGVALPVTTEVHPWTWAWTALSAGAVEAGTLWTAPGMTVSVGQTGLSIAGWMINAIGAGLFALLITLGSWGVIRQTSQRVWSDRCIEASHVLPPVWDGLLAIPLGIVTWTTLSGVARAAEGTVPSTVFEVTVGGSLPKWLLQVLGATLTGSAIVVTSATLVTGAALSVAIVSLSYYLRRLVPLGQGRKDRSQPFTVERE